MVNTLTSVPGTAAATAVTKDKTTTTNGTTGGATTAITKTITHLPVKANRGTYAIHLVAVLIITMCLFGALFCFTLFVPNL